MFSELWSNTLIEIFLIGGRRHAKVTSGNTGVNGVPRQQSAGLETSAVLVLVSIVESIPACHAGDRGSIPRRGDSAGRLYNSGPRLSRKKSKRGHGCIGCELKQTRRLVAGENSTTLMLASDKEEWSRKSQD